MYLGNVQVQLLLDESVFAIVLNFNMTIRCNAIRHLQVRCQFKKIEKKTILAHFTSTAEYVTIPTLTGYLNINDIQIFAYMKTL